MSSPAHPPNGRFGLLEFATAQPPLQPVADLARQVGLGEELVTRMHDSGLAAIPVAPPGRLSDLAAKAVRHLLPRLGGFRVGGMILAHSIPCIAPVEASPLDEILTASGLPKVPAVSVSGQPCAILHQALELAGAWCCALPDNSCVLLVGADRASSVRARFFFGSAMGDSAIAIAVTRDATSHRVLASYSHTSVIAANGELSPPEAIQTFRQMNPAWIRSAILTCLGLGGRELSELAFIVPHTPYLAIWDLVSKLMGFPRERILTDYIAETGHLNSNDSFIHYERAVRENRILPGEMAMLVNPGFGGTRGCTLLVRSVL